MAVIGAGPAGLSAAKKCADLGLRTIIIEKSKFPRDKVSTGMIRDLGAVWLRRVFGAIPREILSTPAAYEGYRLHVPGAGCITVEGFVPNTWSRHLDHWMAQCAMGSGAELIEEAKLLRFWMDDGFYILLYEKAGERRRLKAKYIIGADGGVSKVRAIAFPEQKVYYTHGIQEWYQGKLSLPRDFFNFFTWSEIAPFFCDVCYKAGFFVIEAGAKWGKIDEVLCSFKRILSKIFHFDLEMKPVWRKSCAVPSFYGALLSGPFKPASGRILLTGDAAGLVLPLTGEGIGPAIGSGVIAARAVANSINCGLDAEKGYLEGLRKLLEAHQFNYKLAKKSFEFAAKGGDHLLENMAELWRRSAESLRAFSGGET